jgi:hypothetical protein
MTPKILALLLIIYLGVMIWRMAEDGGDPLGCAELLRKTDTMAAVQPAIMAGVSAWPAGATSPVPTTASQRC